MIIDESSLIRAIHDQIAAQNHGRFPSYAQQLLESGRRAVLSPTTSIEQREQLTELVARLEEILQSRDDGHIFGSCAKPMM